MKSLLLALVFVFLLLATSCYAQYTWSWEELSPMPEAISNNAVSGAMVNGEAYVYSFGGIDTTKTIEGISLTAMRFDVSANDWDYLPPLPDTLGKIAASASTVDNMIYIIGGYHVFDGPPYELSSSKVHRFDPVAGAYLSDGTELLEPIDDQVQVVWRDSLIYVITGWSDTQNVQHVQIYNPQLDTWTMGTPVPNGVLYEAFGASGVIIGDTIYYNGGAVGSSFNSTGRLRKGVIDPDNPSSITWSEEGNNPGDKGYRMAAVSIDEKAFWIGGSGVTYNYDGIAYNGSGGVSPLSRILAYEPVAGEWADMSWQPHAVMDLRGAAEIGGGQFIICGGMETGQQVSDKTYLLSYGGLSSVAEPNPQMALIQGNIIGESGLASFFSKSSTPQEFEIYDLSGRSLYEGILPSGASVWPLAELNIEASGLFFLRLRDSEGALPFAVR